MTNSAPGQEPIAEPVPLSASDATAPAVPAAPATPAVARMPSQIGRAHV